jgi:hypothetical protein
MIPVSSCCHSDDVLMVFCHSDILTILILAILKKPSMLSNNKLKLHSRLQHCNFKVRLSSQILSLSGQTRHLILVRCKLQVLKSFMAQARVILIHTFHLKNFFLQSTKNWSYKFLRRCYKTFYGLN